MELILKATSLMGSVGSVKLDRMNAKCPGVFLEVLKVSKISIELDHSSVYKLYL